jgi:putative membrane-bound dehydrogenase-like protein
MSKYLLLYCFACSIILSCKKESSTTSEVPYSSFSEDDKRKVENALAGIELNDPELEVTLFASEPMMNNPTNMDIDEKGRVWICEAFNYRNSLNPTNPYKNIGDRILIMEDTDKDGKADKSTVFYQGEDINAALGIAVLGNKVIVSCSPNVFVFTDENNDNKADKKEILFSGIKGEQHDHAVHAFLFGPDGKLYFNYGNEGRGIMGKNGQPFKDELGNIIDGSGKPYREGMVFRCNPDGTDLEILGWNFRNNFELTVDSYGRMWQSDNDDDGNKGTRINYVMDYGNYGYKDEFTGAGWRTRRTNMEEGTTLQHWHLNDPGVVPNLVQTYAGSPTGITIYEGDLLPKKYHNQVIHCDAGPNVVRMYPTTKSGAGFNAEIVNILDGSKRDQWFRPSDVTVAPDGSLFVADWYDPGVGGHAMGDTSRGRVYRIAPKGNKYSVPSFDYSTADGAVKALQNPNFSVRHLAFTALEKMGAAAEAALSTLWKSDNSRMKARAMWVMAKTNAPKAIESAIADKDEDIRVAGVRLARESKIDIIPILKKMANDPSPQVRREVAIGLRHKKSEDAAEIWSILASQYDGKDRWYLEVLGVAAEGQWDLFMENYLAKIGDKWKTDPAAKDIIWRSRASNNVVMLAELIKTSSDKEKLRYFRAMDFQTNPLKTETLFGLLGSNTATELGYLVLNHADPVFVQKIPKSSELIKSVISSIQDPMKYLDLVKKYNIKDQNDRLFNWAFTYPDSSLGKESLKLLYDNTGIAEFRKMAEGQDKQQAIKAIKLFGGIDEKTVADYLMSILMNKSKDFDLRKQASESMNGYNSEAIAWQAIKSKKYPEDMIEFIKPALLGSWNGDIRSQALKMFGSNIVSNVNIADLVTRVGSKDKGDAIFKGICMTCHQVNGKGVNFGPGLGEIGSKLSKQGLYEAIIYPNKGISFGYENHSLKMKDGKEVRGIMRSKTENDITLLQVGGVETVYKRSDIKSQTQLEESAMPALAIKDGDLIDLVEYLTSLKKK